MASGLTAVMPRIVAEINVGRGGRSSQMAASMAPTWPVLTIAALLSQSGWIGHKGGPVVSMANVRSAPETQFTRMTMTAARMSCPATLIANAVAVPGAVIATATM